MLTISDFIFILQKYYKSPHKAMLELEEHKISSWKETLSSDGKLQSFISIDPNESLYAAVENLCRRKVHRLPVVDRSTGNVLYILTHKRILRFLYLYVSWILLLLLFFIFNS